MSAGPGQGTVTVPGGAPLPGLADHERDAGDAFRALMNATARPGTLHPLPVLPHAPAPLPPALGALALALADGDTPLWLCPVLAAAPAVAAWLRFHAGAPITDDPAAATFALVADGAALPPLDAFAQGTDEAPEDSVTLLLAVNHLGAGDAPAGALALALAGPGIETTARLVAGPLPADLPARLAANRALFPRGVDLVLAGPDAAGAPQVSALPRTTRVTEA